MPARRRATSAALAGLGATALALVAACGSGGEPVELPSATSSTSSTSPVASASATPTTSGRVVHPVGEKDILGAYSGMLDAYALAAETNDTSVPGLMTYAKGDARKQLGLTLLNHRGRNLHVEGRPVSAPRIESVSPDLNAPRRAKVVDCLDTSKWLLHNADGSVLAGDRGGRRVYTAVLDNADGSWKVNTLVVQEIGSC